MPLASLVKSLPTTPLRVLNNKYMEITKQEALLIHAIISTHLYQQLQHRDAKPSPLLVEVLNKLSDYLTN